MKRANYIGAPEFFCLNEACRIVEEAFNFSHGTYLVGSSLERRDYRDVDVRTILPDAEYDRLFPEKFGSGTCDWRHPLWSFMCSSMSLYLSRHSGLKVDFQIQRMTEANEEYPSPEHPRCALGQFAYRAPPKESAE